ncbi:MAG: hypothetical protein AB3P07_06260 [Wolbachia pipientis]
MNTREEVETASIVARAKKRSSQPILAGVIGAMLLVSGVVFCIMEIHILAIVIGVIGLACIGFALCSNLEPNTRFEKVDQSTPLFFESNIKCCSEKL